MLTTGYVYICIYIYFAYTSIYIHICNVYTLYYIYILLSPPDLTWKGCLWKLIRSTSMAPKNWPHRGTAMHEDQWGRRCRIKGKKHRSPAFWLSSHFWVHAMLPFHGFLVLKVASQTQLPHWRYTAHSVAFQRLEAFQNFKTNWF